MDTVNKLSGKLMQVSITEDRVAALKRHEARMAAYNKIPD